MCVSTLQSVKSHTCGCEGQVAPEEISSSTRWNATELRSQTALHSQSGILMF